MVASGQVIYDFSSGKAIMEIEQIGNVVVTSLTQDDLNDKKTMQAFNEAMNAQQDEYVKYVENIALTLNVSDDYALNIAYLRTRSRWTQELENRLIQMDRDNVPSPNMCEWPSD